MSWPKHVSKFANDNNITLGEAMKNKKCKQLWKELKKIFLLE